MADVRWTAQALDDLDSVCAYIARDSPHYAQMFATDVFGAAEQLERFPRLGRVVPEVARDTVRELIVGELQTHLSGTASSGGNPDNSPRGEAP
nr:type II toxin-antitoxin system RelE/ParE family toxin [Bacillota bacterium]